MRNFSRCVILISKSGTQTNIHKQTTCPRDNNLLLGCNWKQRMQWGLMQHGYLVQILTLLLKYEYKNEYNKESNYFSV